MSVGQTDDARLRAARHTDNVAKAFCLVTFVGTIFIGLGFLLSTGGARATYAFIEMNVLATLALALVVVDIAQERLSRIEKSYVPSARERLADMARGRRT